MTTAFQTVIDNATTLSFNKRKKVAQTQSRSGVIKTTSLGGQVWEFQAKLPDGPRYSDYRQLIEAMEALDKTTVGQIQLNNAGHSYISGYQGDFSTLSNITVTIATSNTLTLTVSPTLTSGYRFRAGDYIQLGTSGSVYTVAEDVPHTSATITTHRPILEADTQSYSLIVGPSVSWDVICVQFPNYTLFGYDQISWSGPFIFVEAL